MAEEIKGTLTNSYAVLADGNRIEIYRLGPKKQAVVRDPQGKVVIAMNPSFSADVDILIEEAAIAVSESASSSNIVKKYIEPEPKPEPKPTPQQVNDKTQQETNKKTEQQNVTEVSKTDAKVTEKNTPPKIKPQGADKLALVINKKRSEIKRVLIPMAVAIAAKAGIQNIGTPQVKQPDTCLTQKEIDDLIRRRNQLVNRLNNIVRIIDSFTKIITGINLVLTITLTLIQTLKISRKAASIATKFIPSPPGTPGALVTTLDDLKDIVDATTPKLWKATGYIAIISLSLSLINSVLLKIIAMLNSIDFYLNKCSQASSASGGPVSTVELVPLSPTLLALEKVNKEIEANEQPDETYNGFVLAIEEVQFSPTVTRRKAVAKNKSGITLISTPLSFTTDDQTLLNQIKLLIDSNNLKAD